ncbi:glutamate-5-semialdehyde dehydrogenase [Legionella sp. km772]|uniref:glutamate-5-semialdehyde dehydrogenase n=1 Tax=Legionella sp. km772 TaxID=2498111 RepID=UPI000F8DB6DB|nr:glutamate-5-semialdehyde dehydrogenase [Legionella sp. km772]
MSCLKQVKDASCSLSFISENKRKQILEELANQLVQAIPELIAANKKDLELMDKTDPKYDRLLLSESRIQALINDIRLVASLTHHSQKILEEKVLPNGLKLKKITVPLGVVAVIYESRPNVTVDVFCLCFKSGNACVLKGGKEAYHSNQFLVALINKVLSLFQINPYSLYLLPPEREAMDVVLKARGYIDVCIPRGGQELINHVREHARIPVIETGSGIVHTYFDASGSLEKGRLIINNAKTRRVSVCNALDTLLIHKERLKDLPYLLELLAEQSVMLFADDLSFNALEKHYPERRLQHAEPAHYGQEYLDYKMSIKTVDSVEEAVTHINAYTSGHSEAIITEEPHTAAYFSKHIDAAVIYINASTAFTDGGQFGMGAEIGISTQKLHARGPMALDALTSYKWMVEGNGQIRLP